MVDWLERLNYGAESRRKACVRGWASPCDDWKTLSVNQAVNWYLFHNMECWGSERRGMSSAFHQLCQRYSGTLTPAAPTAIRLWETFIFTFLYLYPPGNIGQQTIILMLKSYQQ